MKYLLLTFLCWTSIMYGFATDPIKTRSFYLSIETSYTFQEHIKQIEFSKQGHILGFGVIFGHRQVPVFGEYFYQFPITYRYRNNVLKMQYQELGIRYNLNQLHYMIPNGIDPYLGLSIMRNHSSLIQEGISSPEIISSQEVKNYRPKISTGVKVGSRMITLGLQYDFIPGTMKINSAEGAGLTLFNEMHFVSARVGFRINSLFPNRISCPRFKTRQKRTIRF